MASLPSNLKIIFVPDYSRVLRAGERAALTVHFSAIVNLGLENNLGSDTAFWFNERFAISLWGHLEQRFGTERPRKLLALDDEAMAGLVRLIACHRGATESQSLKHLGFPDATVVSTRSWVYVADEVQKIQIVFLANCCDETTTNLGLQGFFEWLAQVQEEMRLSARAAARSRIVRAIAREAAVQPQVPAPALKKSKRIQISQIQSNKHPLPK